MWPTGRRLLASQCPAGFLCSWEYDGREAGAGLRRCRRSSSVTVVDADVEAGLLFSRMLWMATQKCRFSYINPVHDLVMPP